MKTSNLTCVLLLALLLQTTFAQIFLASESTITARRADKSNSAAAQNLRAKGPKDQNAVDAAKKIKDGFLEAARGSCKSKGGSKCKPEVPALGIKGTPEIAEQLRDYWQTRRKESYDDLKALTDNFLTTRSTQNAQKNFRSLFSVNNQYPQIDESNILAWQDNYLYIDVHSRDQFRIVKVNGTNLTTVYQMKMKFDRLLLELVVFGEFFALISHENIQSPKQVLIITVYRRPLSTSATVTFVKQFTREGYLLKASEVAGYLHVVTQHSQMTDLSWQVSGVGSVGANINFCASWDGNGNWIRDIAAISLSLNPTYTFDVYLGCDAAVKANLAPSGNWYIASLSGVNRYIDSIIHKVHRIEPLPSQWAGLPKTSLDMLYNEVTGWNEQGNCTLQVAGRPSQIGKQLNLFAFDCREFDLVATSGPVQADKYLSNVRWIGQSVYVIYHGLPQIWKFQRNSTNFSFKGKIPSKPYIQAMYEYGPEHIIALAFDGSLLSVILIDLKSFTTVIEYNIIRDGDHFVNSFSSQNQDIDVDFPNKRVVFSISSQKNEPYRDGYFYLHIEVSPIPCMTAPPINSCNVTGTARIQNQTLSGKVYKHWDQMGLPWQTTPSDYIHRSVTLASGTKKYLYTFSRCQLQVRAEEDFIGGGGKISYKPTSYIDLCP